MKLDSASAISVGGAMLWTRFLQKSQGGDVRWLNRTLILPTTDRSGVLSDRLAPRVFEEIHEKGKNPDGKYWMEFDDSGNKFNLLERVCERVPKSREWLLRGFLDYTKADENLPPLLASRGTLLAYLNERDLLFVPAPVIAVAKLRDPTFFSDIKERAMAGLISAATPSTLLFLIAFLREVRWRRTSDIYPTYILAHCAVEEFVDSFERRRFDGAVKLADQLRGPLQDIPNKVQLIGDRCASSVVPPGFECLGSLPFLMEKGQDALDACDCLIAASEDFYIFDECSLPSMYSEGATEISRYGVTAMVPSETMVAEALQVLDDSISKAHRRIAREYDESLLFTSNSAERLVNKADMATSSCERRGPRLSGSSRRHS